MIVSQPKPYSSSKNPRGYWLSEKLDGVRARWTGAELLSKSGNVILAPYEFQATLPAGVALDGELWAGRGTFERVLAVAATKSGAADWSGVRLMVFDSPSVSGAFAERWEAVESLAESAAWARIAHRECSGRDDLAAEMARITSDGGEGVVLHHPMTEYEQGPTWSAMKVKRRDDSDGVVIAHIPGAGEWSGECGSLLIRTHDGDSFALPGMPEAMRSNPPPLGEIVSFWHNGFTARGIPREARFHRVRGAF